jgi:hypothetical protein
MKKLLVALGFALAATGASANIVSGGSTLTGEGVAAMTFSDGGWGAIAGLAEGSYQNGDGLTGTLIANNTGTFTATYLGQVASFANMYFGTTQNAGLLGENIRATTTMNVNANQIIAFYFQDGGNGTLFGNGGDNTANGGIQGIAYFMNTYGLLDNEGNLFDFLIGYNDSADVNSDFDDYVVGVRAVPVPAALPLMASAIGLFGLSRRKNKAKVA